MDIVSWDKYYRYIFEKSMDGILLTAPEGTIYRANPAMCQMLQRSEAEIINLGREGIVNKQDPRLLPALIERATRGSVITEITLIRKDGTISPVYLTATLFKDDNGKVWSSIIVKDISAQRKVQDQLALLQEETALKAVSDPLTGLLNRGGFIERLEAEMARSRRNDLSVCLIMMDIDRFKWINDSYGHLFGDTTLQDFALGVASILRPYDFLGRFGGDEFIVCLPNTQFKEALNIAERIRQHVEKLEIKHPTGSISITASLGVAAYDSDAIVDIDAVLTLADTNMYIAKQKRNYVYGTKGKDIMENMTY